MQEEHSKGEEASPPCEGCINNRLSARIRRFFAVLAPSAMVRSAPMSPLESCLKRQEEKGGLDAHCE